MKLKKSQIKTFGKFKRIFITKKFVINILRSEENVYANLPEVDAIRNAAYVKI